MFGNLADTGANQQAFEDKKGNPQVDSSVWGFFLGETGIISEVKRLQLITRFTLHVFYSIDGWMGSNGGVG
ncbi:MAG: hypothetical protein LWW97_03940 [Deltaproteobacteria bacterium]|nr:hypothetical protein [Deltaproteobacteria bacterium]